MSRFLLSIGLVAILSACCQAISVLAPSGLEHLEGNSNNVLPFGSTGETMRYQQVFDAVEFGALTRGGVITQIAFRPDASFNFPISGTISNIQINLSTTAATSDALSELFAANLGLDDTVVFSGPLTLSSSDIGLGPRQFEFVITLQTPFRYDPIQGNLLLDVRMFSRGIVASFDFHQMLGDSVSRIWSSNVNSSTADSISEASGGLVTLFTFVVPEPSSLLLLGLFGPAVLSFRRADRAK